MKILSNILKHGRADNLFYPLKERHKWSGHLDNCAYPEDSSGMHVTPVDIHPVLSPSVEWSGHPDNCVYPEDSSDTHVTQD
ncbi:hypothetical protein GQ457_14G012150 [Hibiscus cannabinus]